MRRGERIAVICASLYGAVAVGTFGYSAAQTYRREQAAYADCQAKEMLKQRRFCLDDSSFTAGAYGLSAALLWPLYWSWEVQQ